MLCNEIGIPVIYSYCICHKGHNAGALAATKLLHKKATICLLPTKTGDSYGYVFYHVFMNDNER